MPRKKPIKPLQPTLNCGFCGLSFLQARKWQRFCCSQHQAASKNLRRKEVYAELKAENLRLKSQLAGKGNS
jgi:hypothetical protein